MERPADRPAIEGLPDSRRRAGAEAARGLRRIVRAVGPVRRERAGRDWPRCDSRRPSRTRSPTRWAYAYANCPSPPRKSTARCTRGCTRTRRRPPGGAEGRHVVAHLLRAAVRRASARARSSCTPRASRRRSGSSPPARAALVCGGMSHALRRERTGFPQAKRLVSIVRIPELNDRPSTRAAPAGGAAVRQQALYDDPRVKQDLAGDRRRDGSRRPHAHPPHADGGRQPRTARRRLRSPSRPPRPQTRASRWPDPRDGTRSRSKKHSRSVSPRDEMVVISRLDAPPAPLRLELLQVMARQVPRNSDGQHRGLRDARHRRHVRGRSRVRGSGELEADRARLEGAGRAAGWAKTCWRAVQNVRQPAEPMPDVRGSAAYKREMAVEFSLRALSAAWRRRATMPIAVR